MEDCGLSVKPVSEKGAVMKWCANNPGSLGNEVSTVASKESLRSDVIATFARPMCPFCGEAGAHLYESLKDELFGAPGSWGFRRCENPECDLIWLDPTPLASELSKAYRSYYTHTQSGSIDRIDAKWWVCARLIGLYGHLVHYTGLSERRQDLLTRHLDGVKPGSLLEIGCGDGSFLSVARERGWKTTGVDSDPQAAQAALKKYGIVVQVGRIEDCDFPREHFDLIVMNHVIEHVLDPAALLSACAAILRREGRVLLVTPNSAGLGHVVFGRRWRGLEPPRHFHLFSPGTLERTTHGNGLHCVCLNTTSVNAEAIFWGSTGLGGAEALIASPPPWQLLFQSWFYQFYALARNLWNRKGGEEIVMVCRKGPKTPAKE